jgi:nucleoside-diphosphate-sugar epimerase
VLVRAESRASFPLVHPALTVFVGDVTDARSVEAAAVGVDAVVHAAAKVSDFGARDDFYRANVVGTEVVLDVCRRARVRRLVHVSTPSVVTGARGQRDVVESEPYPARFLSHYAATKAAAEQTVRRVAESTGLEAVILRPRAVWGAGDAQSAFPRVLRRLAEGRVPRIQASTPPLVDLCHVDNAVEACLLALVAERAVGGTYFITDGVHTLLWEWIDRVCDTFALPRPTRRVPAGAASALATVVEGAWWIFGLARVREPPLTRYAVKLFSESVTFSIEAARRDLGYQPHHDVGRGLLELKAWVERAGGVERFVSASVHDLRRVAFAHPVFPTWEG